jgi:predicted transcriptional regulator
MHITIKELQEKWGVARATVYKHLKAGKLSRLDSGLLDVSEVVRVYGEPKNKPIGTLIDSVESQEKQLLLDKIKMLEQTVQQSHERETWLKSQVEIAQTTIKLLEYKQPQKKGIFSRVLDAINNGG